MSIAEIQPNLKPPWVMECRASLTVTSYSCCFCMTWRLGIPANSHTRSPGLACGVLTLHMDSLCQSYNPSVASLEASFLEQEAWLASVLFRIIPFEQQFTAHSDNTCDDKAGQTMSTSWRLPDILSPLRMMILLQHQLVWSDVSRQVTTYYFLHYIFIIRFRVNFTHPHGCSNNIHLRSCEMCVLLCV